MLIYDFVSEWRNAGTDIFSPGIVPVLGENVS
jgi:hypothetical protein